MQKMLRNIVVAMFADEASKWFVTITTGQWNWAYLPLHLCSASMFVALLNYKTGSPLSKEFLFAVSLPGTAMALLFPNWISLPFCNKILGIFEKNISLCCKDSFLYKLSISRQKHVVFTLKWAKNVPENHYAISNKARYYDRFYSLSIEIHPISKSVVQKVLSFLI